MPLLDAQRSSLDRRPSPSTARSQTYPLVSATVPLTSPRRTSSSTCLPASLALAAEAIAAELRARGRLELNDSMRVLAARLGVSIHEHPVRGLAGVAVRSAHAVLLSPSGYAPRDEFTLAHELMELYLPSQWRRALPEKLKERACDRGAAALLLPRQQFLFSLHGTGWDLPALRRRWPTASWGAIAARLVDLVPGVSACTWVDHRRASWRYDPALELHHVGAAELIAVEQAQRHGRAVVVRRRLRARAWRLVARQGRKVTLAVVES
jgi:IrrE N-terminal-like domain